MKIDIYNHIFPQKYFDKMVEVMPHHEDIGKRVRNVPVEDHILFASDSPFDPEKGPGYIRSTIGVIDQLDITAEERAKIYQGNAERLMKLKL